MANQISVSVPADNADALSLAGDFLNQLALNAHDLEDMRRMAAAGPDEVDELLDEPAATPLPQTVAPIAAVAEAVAPAVTPAPTAPAAPSK